MSSIFDPIYNGQPQVSGKAPAEQYTEITIGDPLAPAGSDWGVHQALHVNYGSTDKGTGAAEKGHLCPRCGQMFKESKMVNIGGIWLCLENGDAQDQIKELSK